MKHVARSHLSSSSAELGLKRPHAAASPTVLLTASLMLPFVAEAAPGDLDESFGTDGKVISDFGGEDGAYGVALQADGKIVAAGQFGNYSGSTEIALARYRRNGSPDLSFGENGRVSISFDGQPRRMGIAHDVAIQSDGKILAAGYVSDTGIEGEPPPDPSTIGFAVLRFRANGTLDPKFGKGGIVISNWRKMSIVYGIALQADGKILVAGQAYDRSTSSSDFALARLLPNGKLDPTFGRRGVVITDFGGRNDFARAITLQPDGRIVVAGRGDSGAGTIEFALARYLSNGKLDTTFGAGGLVTTFVGDGYEAMDLALQADGKLVVVGQRFAIDTDFALVRYDANGSPDPTFGSGGYVTIDLGQTELANAVALQEDGKIVVAGRYTDSSGEYSFVLARLESDGSLDSSWGDQGYVVTSIGVGPHAEVRDIVVQANGKVVAAGLARGSDGGGDFALARYRGDGSR